MKSLISYLNPKRMANSKLEDKLFIIPDNIIKTVKPGTMRSDFVIRRKDGLSYYNIKRLKNFFDNDTEKDPKTYECLGDTLKNWVENILSMYRDSMNKGKRIKSDIGMLNIFKKAHSKDKSNGKLGLRLPKPNTTARQLFTGKGLYENAMSQLLIQNEEKDINEFIMWEQRLGLRHDNDTQNKWLNAKKNLKGVDKNIKVYESKDHLLDKINNGSDDIFRLKETDKIIQLKESLNDDLINKYSTIISSPLYNNVDDIIKDILYFDNKSKKYKK
jgi:hypothetical protein